MAPAPDSPLARALRAVDLATRSPAAAERLAGAVAAATGAPAEARSVAHRALGQAAMARGDPAAAARWLRRAARLAEGAGLADRAVEARAGLVHALAAAGRLRDALAEADRAAGRARGRPAAVLAYHRAVALTRLGRIEEAVACYDRALAAFARRDDGHAAAMTRLNRGVLLAYRGRWPAALADLERAVAAHRAAGRRLATAQAVHNLGYVLALRGDVPAALARFDQAAALFDAVDGDAGLLLVDRAEVLLSVGLAGEARQVAEAAAAAYAGRRLLANLAEARLVLARAALAAGDAPAARQAAGQARRAFLAQRRPGWAAVAGLVGLQAGPAGAGGRRAGARAAQARRVAAELAASGLATAAFEAQLLVAGLAVEGGQPEAAAALLARLRRARARAPAEVAARAWYVEARVRAARGDRPGTRAALRAGLAVVDRLRATLGATDLRAAVAGHATGLAELGLALAVEDGRAGPALAWAERCRAATVLLRPARPPRQARLARDVAELRTVARRLEAAAMAGRPTAALARRQRALEEAVRAAARHAPAAWPGRAAEPAPVAALAAALGPERALVEYLAVAGRLWAVVVAAGRAGLHQLGPLAGVAAELHALRFALRRAALGLDRDGAATASAALAAEAVDRALLAPLAGPLGDRHLVVVPTGPLSAVPWGALPACAGRPVAVAPSAAAWLRAARPAPRAGRTGRAGRAPVLVAGPGLPAAAAEVAALARRYPGAVRLTGRRATAAAVAASLDGAGLAHLATHGSFRGDNPLFSCLHLADGPLTVYDLEGLRRAPELVVLSACDSALADAGPGDELVGLASALLALGTRALVAAVLPVPDDATRRFMARLHRALHAGTPPAAALAAARRGAGSRGPADAAAAAAFVCLGAG